MTSAEYKQRFFRTLRLDLIIYAWIFGIGLGAVTLLCLADAICRVLK